MRHGLKRDGASQFLSKALLSTSGSIQGLHGCRAPMHLDVVPITLILKLTIGLKLGIQ